MCTAVEEMNIGVILAVVNTTEPVLEIRRPVLQSLWVQTPYGPEFFSSLISTTSSVVFITARIASILILIQNYD